MSNSLAINFENLRSGPMKGTLDALEAAFRHFDIDFYLIGAFARDLWIDHLDHLPTRRATLDIDFSIYIREYDQFKALKTFLVEEHRFRLTDEPYRLFSADEVVIDLIPFGGVEHDHIVYLDEQPPMDLSVFGHMEVLAHAEQIVVSDSNFKICTLPGLCILKLIAGFENPWRFPKDIGDFYYILDNYADIAGEKLFDAPYDDLLDQDLPLAVAAAHLLGRQIAEMLDNNTLLKKRIMENLQKLTERFTDEEINEMFRHEPADEKIRRFKLVCCVKFEAAKE
jgi:predicted nucleotidyltransferase